MLETAYGGRIFRIPPHIIAALSPHPLLGSFMLTRMGYFVDAHEHATERASIDEYIIIYCAGGEGWLHMAGESWRIGPGDVAIVFKDEAHRYEADTASPWSIFWAHMNGAQVKYYLDLAQITAQEPVRRLRESNRLIHVFTEISAILQMGYSVHNLLRCSDHLRLMLSYIAASGLSYEGASRFDMEQVIGFMVENLTGTCSLPMLATHVNLSPSYLAHVFRTATGYSPIDYYIRLKIQKACELLELTTMTVSEISEHLGYSTPYYFSRVFKKSIGLPPSAYRQSIGQSKL